MKEYRPRIVDEMLKDKLEAKGAVLIEGPKWCGKTTTALQVAASVLRMDEPSRRAANIQMSEIEPERLLEGDTPRLIDEWQIAPKLWDAARYEVDIRGGWPHAIGMKEKAALSQAEDYYDAVVKSDINRADGVNKNPERVKRLMRSFARNQGGADRLYYT